MRTALLVLTLSFAFHATDVRAQWQPDGTPLCVALLDQQLPQIIPDGVGGAIVTWQDYRSSGFDIYAQRINALGVAQWAANGVALCLAGSDQAVPMLASDGANGAIVTWYDYRGAAADIYIQRINAAGAVQWAANGVALCVAVDNQFSPTIVADGTGGAIVTWHDFRPGATADIYAQRVNFLGQVQWAVNGVALCAAGNSQSNPIIVSDGSGGAIAVWPDNRGANIDLYAQRVNPLGAVQWLANGVAVSAAAGDQSYPKIIADNVGGAVVTWADNRNGSDDIYAQRINAAGGSLWTANGVTLCSAAGTQSSPAIVADGANGAIVAWHDVRGGVTYDIYAQRITASGAVQWTFQGVPLCTAVASQLQPTIAADGANGAIVTWYDNRSGNNDIYAQRVNSFGAMQWVADGVVLSAATGIQQYPTIASNGAGGAIVSWADIRNGLSSDIYVQRVEGTYGYWGRPDPIATSVADIPHDQGGKVALNWTASGRDLPVPATIDFYSVWRAVDVAPLASSAAETPITPLDQIRPDTAPGVRTKLPASSYYWELVGTQTAYRQPAYSFSAETRADSVAGSTGNEFFMVMAHDRTDEHIAFASNVVSGHSVDNLAPAAPLLLVAQRIGNYVYLTWNGVHVPDLRDYSVYRKTSTGVTPVPINFLSSADDTVLTDSSPPISALYYIVTAHDVHANQSAPSNEASVQASTGVGDTPSITQLTVLPNHPNPFNETTELEVGLPAPSDVQVEIYDVAGRRVNAFDLKQASAGWKQIPFSARDSAGRALASGVYFYRVTASGSTITRKMVIAR